VSDDTHLTVATLNLENLWAGSETEKFDRLAAIISTQLGSPDVLAVQEVQDDSGPENNGVVEADETLGRLVEAVRNAGGVDYRWRLVDPADNADGGQPGANIRTAFLYNPDRVGFADRADCGTDRAVVVDEGSGLSCSPGLIDPANRAFAQGEDGRGGSRKPLVGEFIFNGRSLVVVNLHLSSKGGDDPIFGRRQPRITSTTRRRVSQAEAVGGFVRDVLDRDAEAAVIVLGDLNDFEKSEPLTALETAGLEDLVMRLPPEQRYSYVYLGVSQVLDHILVSSSLAEGAEIEAVHVNSDFPANSRASDHDPIIVRLKVPR
jgi:predicted extracellular nuclease